MVTRNLVKIGNSRGVVIPKDILTGMNLPEEATCEIRITGPRTLQLKFLEERDVKVQQAIQDFVEKYQEDLEALSKE